MLQSSINKALLHHAGHLFINMRCKYSDLSHTIPTTIAVSRILMKILYSNHLFEWLTTCKLSFSNFLSFTGTLSVMLFKTKQIGESK